MAKTAAQYQQAYRDRKKAQIKQERSSVRPISEIIHSGADQNFAAFYRQNAENITHPESLEWVGVTINASLGDEPPKLDKAQLWHEVGREVSSLSVAFARMEVFLDAAKELAELINKYQVQKIDEQLASASPEKIGRLEALKVRLTKKTSHFFPVID